MRTLICIHCEIEFDLQEKLNQSKILKRNAGKINECIDCASEDPVKVTGVMIYGHKTAGSIQINKDPRLTEYMLSSSPSAGTRCAMVQRLPATKTGAALHLSKDLTKRR